MIPIAKGKYQEWLTHDGLLRIEGWAREGLTDAQIAAKMGIYVSTLYKYQNEHNEIREALKRGKAPVDLEIENALYKRAKGYTYTETIEEITTTGEKGQDGQYKVKERHTRKVTKEMPPDVTAIIYWLNNRRPDRWKNRKAAESEAVNETLEKAKQILGSVESAIN